MKIVILASLLVLISCGGGSSIPDFSAHQNVINQSKEIFSSNKKFYPAKKGNSNFENLKRCAFDYDGNACSLEKTPFILKSSKKITPEVILNHTLVSHEFFVEIFEKFLRNTKNEYLLKMFGSVSGVVLTDEISSSFYLGRTGMIYIDGRYLWQTQEQRNQLKFEEDKRGAAHTKKNISLSHSYYRNGQRLVSSYSKDERSDEDNFGMLTGLIFHELAHAMDFFPPKRINELTTSKPYGEIAYENFKDNKISSDEIGFVQSDDAWKYAQFYYYNRTFDDVIPAYSVSDFLKYFREDNSVSLYSYTTRREHFAMLIEAFMMTQTEEYEECLKIYREYPNGDWETYWGERNRVLNNQVLPYAKKAVSLVFPNSDSKELLGMVKDEESQTRLYPGWSSTSCF